MICRYFIRAATAQKFLRLYLNCNWLVNQITIFNRFDFATELQKTVRMIDSDRLKKFHFLIIYQIESNATATYFAKNLVTRCVV